MDHTKDLCNSLVKYTGIFYHLKDLLPKKTALHIYYAFVVSKLRYAIEIYGTAKASILKPVQVLQNKLIKLLTGKPRHHPTKQLYHEYNLFMLGDIHSYYMCQIIYKYCNNMLPNAISTAIFPPCNSVLTRPTTVSTRNRDLFAVSHHNTSHGRFLLNNYCYRLWQDIPPEIKSSKSLQISQNRVKHFILNK